MIDSGVNGGLQKDSNGFLFDSDQDENKYNEENLSDIFEDMGMAGYDADFLAGHLIDDGIDTDEGIINHLDKNGDKKVDLDELNQAYSNVFDTDGYGNEEVDIGQGFILSIGAKEEELLSDIITENGDLDGENLRSLMNNVNVPQQQKRDVLALALLTIGFTQDEVADILGGITTSPNKELDPNDGKLKGIVDIATSEVGTEARGEELKGIKALFGI